MSQGNGRQSRQAPEATDDSLMSRNGEHEVVRGRPGRRGVEERTQAVLELLAGKSSVQQLALRFGVREETIESWRADALAGISETFRRGTSKSARERELERELEGLKAAFTDLAIRHELVDRALRNRPSRPGRSAK